MSLISNMFDKDVPPPDELTENFYWICAKDIFFATEDGLETSYIKLKGKNTGRYENILLLKRGNFYKIGQYEHTSLATVDFKNASSSSEEEKLRHPLLFVQQYKLPANMPMNQFLLGPVKAINMTRILRLIQADLSDDKEMMEDIVQNLHLSYSAEGFPYLMNKFA